MANISQTIGEFEKGRAQLSSIAVQRQQLSIQSESLSQSIEELKKTKEEKVFKATGNILILSPVQEVLKDVEEKKESVDLRFKTVQKQESILLDKLEKLKKEIEKAQGGSKTVSKEKEDLQKESE